MLLKIKIFYSSVLRYHKHNLGRKKVEFSQVTVMVVLVASHDIAPLEQFRGTSFSIMEREHESKMGTGLSFYSSFLEGTYINVLNKAQITF